MNETGNEYNSRGWIVFCCFVVPFIWATTAGPLSKKPVAEEAKASALSVGQQATKTADSQETVAVRSKGLARKIQTRRLGLGS